MEGETGRTRVSLTEDRPIDEKVRGSLQTYIAGLTVPQKLELAAKGNREVRQILSRDPNKIVARAVVGSPRLSENDITSYVSSSLTNEEILRAIGESREWTSKPRLLSMLILNPRTPVPVAMRYLSRMPVNVLGMVYRNPNINPVIRREAKRIVVRAASGLAREK